MHGLMREGWHPVAMIRLVRHRQTKGAVTDRPDLRARDACSLLYPALTHPQDNAALPGRNKWRPQCGQLAAYGTNVTPLS
jgi:hypothetical protein